MRSIIKNLHCIQEHALIFTDCSHMRTRTRARTHTSNPWNAVYRLASNKNRKSSTMTTVLKPDGSYTSNLNETMQVMLDHLITKDDQTEDTEYHKRIRKQIKDPIQTAHD